MLKRPSLFLLAILGLAFAVTAFSPTAQAAEEDDIKYRKSVMKALGGHMGSAAAIVGGKAGSPAHLGAHAAAIADMAAITKDLFPEGSDFGETTALPKIWNEPEAFARELAAFEAAAQAFAKAAGSGDMAATGVAMGALGKQCKSCHETYREKKK